MPCGVVSIKVPKDERVRVFHIVEERAEVEGVARRARGRWRDVDVKNERRDLVDFDGYSNDFDGAVADEGTIDSGEGKRVVDEQSHSTASTFITRTMEKSVAWNVDVR